MKIGVDEINIEIDVNEKKFLDLKDKFKLIFEPEKEVITAYNSGLQ